jgi:photosystem II stability/assembly factor-like uncharacterized protein
VRRYSTRRVLIMSVLLVLSLIPMSNIADATTARSWPLLTNVSLGTGTQIDSIDFVSPSLGYGIASNSYEGRSKHASEPFYLVSTMDQATRWRLGPRVPLPPTKGAGPYQVPLVDFVTPSIGYVGEQQGVGGDLQVTTDTGAHWTKLRAPGVDDAFAVSGTTAAVVTVGCHNVEERNCSAILSLFHDGSATPYESQRIPQLVSGGDSQLYPALTAISATTYVFVDGQNFGRPSTILETANGGATWLPIPDPCGKIQVNQLLAESTSSWLLACWQDQGMSQGPGSLWRTTNSGVNWSSIRDAINADRGLTNVGVDASVLSYNRNDGIIYGTVYNPGGGLEYSVDGGRSWTYNSDPDMNDGGAAESLATFGSSGAVLDELHGELFRTLNGTSWAALPGLSPGRFRGDPICTARTVSVSQSGRVRDLGGWKENLDFTNNSDHACYLYGTPELQKVAGPTRRKVGWPSQYLGDYGTGSTYVTLSALGGTASVKLQFFPAGNTPSSGCHPTAVKGVTATFGPGSVFYVPMPKGVTLCNQAWSMQSFQVE